MSSDDENFPPTPAPGTHLAWRTVEAGSNDEVDWGGNEWTERRRFRFGSPFLELPRHPQDEPIESTPEPVSANVTPTRQFPVRASKLVSLFRR